MSGTVEIVSLAGIDEVAPGDELGALIAAAAEAADVELADGEVVVVSQKVVSKAEARTVRLDTVAPSERALGLARELGKDPRLVELILGESRRVVRAAGGVLITETASGWICANAGIDASNVPGEGTVTLLPEDADASARRIRAAIEAMSGARPGVIIADSFGRPWRIGQTDVAIGCAGVLVVDDWRGRTDPHGRRLGATAIAAADELAAAADLARTKVSGAPAVVIRGCERLWTAEDGAGATALQRRADHDLFR